MFSSRALQPIAVTFPAHGIFVLESHHTRGFRMPPVRHDFLKVIQPFAGSGWLVRKGLRVPLQPGDVVLVPAGERHHLEDGGTRPLSLYALCVAAAAPTTPVTGGVFRAYRHFPAPPWGPEFRGLIRHLLHEQTLGRPGSDLMMLGLAWQALGHLARAASGRQPLRGERTHLPAEARVAAYAAELARTFYHRQSVGEAASALGLSRRHFTQLFREITGESWLERLRLHRLAHARRLLRETERSATSIGYECGFEDITTFYRAFKAAEGTSPLAWRNRSGASARRRRPHRQKTASSTPN